MKQRLSAVLLVLVSGSPAWADNLIFMDRFNNGLGPWILDQTGGTVTIATVTNSTKMVLDDTSGLAVVSATRSFTAPSERYNLEFDGYYASGASLSAQLLDASNNVIISAEITGGNIRFETDATTAATSAWPSSVYKQVTLTVDPAGDTVRCYVTQTSSARRADEQVQVGATKPYSGTAIAKVRFITGSSTTGAGRIDEVRIYRPNIFVIGDSIAAGKPFWANDPGNSNYRQQAGNSETSPPQYHLGLLLSDGNEWVANRGFGGAWIDDVCDRLQLMAIDQGAQKIILHVGHNDVYYGRTLSQMQTDLAGCVSALSSARLTGDEVTLSNILPSRLLTNDPKRTIHVDYNQHLLSICAANGYTCVDSFSLLVDPSNPTALRSSFNSGDGTHLSAAGSVALAQSWLGLVRASGQYVLAVTPAGTGSGTTTGAGIYNHGQTATVTATANTGSTFAGWSGPDGEECATGSVLMTADKSCVATFTLGPYALTVTKAGNGSGVVTSSPEGIDCGVSCSAAFELDTQVTLTASADPGSVFTGWGGACSGTGACVVTLNAPQSVTATFEGEGGAVPSVSALVNTSTRGAVSAPDGLLIEGFIIGGTAPKAVLVRVRGPSLVQFGVPVAMANPYVELYSGPTKIAQNDNWQTTDPLCGAPAVSCGSAAEIAATNLDPCHIATTGCTLDSAILITLPPGPYTAIVRGVGGTGVANVGVFDVDQSNGAKLVNVSSRGLVLTGDSVMIGGFIVGGGTGQKTVLVRVRGPSLTAFGVEGAIANPYVELYSGSTKIAQNDNWQTTDPLCGSPAISCGNAADIQATGLDPCSITTAGCTLDSAILITLPPGPYTAIVRGVGGATGVANVGAFDLSQ